jgi:hypothetical protein
MSKPGVSAKAVVADIKSGVSDAEMMSKYQLSAKGLESLYSKLIERNLVTSAELAGRRAVPSERSELESPEPGPQSASRAAQSGINAGMAQAAVDHIRKGSHDSEIMADLGLSPSQLQKLLEDLVRSGHLSSEELEARKPRKTKQCRSCSATVGAADVTCEHCGQDPDQPRPTTSQPPPDHESMGVSSDDMDDERYCAWEDRESQGTINAYIQTASRLLLSPAAFFSKLPLDGGYWSPILFSVMSIVVGAVFTSLWLQIIRGGAGAFGLIGLLFLMSLTFVGSLMFVPIALFFWGLVTHGLLVLLNGGKNGFEPTFRVIAYSSLTSVFSAIPIVGNLASLWGLYLIVIGLRDVHETSTGKAAGAALIPVSIIVLMGLLLGVMSSDSSVGKRPHQRLRAAISTECGGTNFMAKGNTCSALPGNIYKNALAGNGWRTI